jgi:hypothetical protein
MKELKVSVEDPYLEVIFLFLRQMLSAPKSRPQTLIIPTFPEVFRLTSLIRFTDEAPENPEENSENEREPKAPEVHLEAENISEEPTKFQSSRFDPYQQNKTHYGIAEQEAALGNCFYAPTLLHSDYLEFKLLRGKKYVFYKIPFCLDEGKVGTRRTNTRKKIHGGRKGENDGNTRRNIHEVR